MTPQMQSFIVHSGTEVHTKGCPDKILPQTIFRRVRKNRFNVQYIYSEKIVVVSRKVCDNICCITNHSTYVCSCGLFFIRDRCRHLIIVIHNNEDNFSL